MWLEVRGGGTRETKRVGFRARPPGFVPGASSCQGYGPEHVIWPLESQLLSSVKEQVVGLPIIYIGRDFPNGPMAEILPPTPHAGARA